MKTASFKVLTDRLNTLLDGCEQFHQRVGSVDDINSISIERFNWAIGEAQQLLSKCDKVSRDDLYHIIGMGNLSASQMSAFAKQIKRLGTYRHDLKWFAGHNRLSVGKYSRFSTYSPSIMDTPLTKGDK